MDIVNEIFALRGKYNALREILFEYEIFPYENEEKINTVFHEMMMIDEQIRDLKKKL